MMTILFYMFAGLMLAVYTVISGFIFTITGEEKVYEWLPRPAVLLWPLGICWMAGQWLARNVKVFTPINFFKNN